MKGSTMIGILFAALSGTWTVYKLDNPAPRPPSPQEYHEIGSLLGNWALDRGQLAKCGAKIDDNSFELLDALVRRYSLTPKQSATLSALGKQALAAGSSGTPACQAVLQNYNALTHRLWIRRYLPF